MVLLRRIAIGTLRLGQMPVGASRMLTPAEVKALYAASDPANRAKRTAAKSAAAPGRTATNPTQIKPKRLSERWNENSDDDDDDDLLSQALSGVGKDHGGDRDGDPEDDFVGDLSGTGGRGSVLTFEFESPKASEGRAARKPAQRREPPIRSAGAARRMARATDQEPARRTKKAARRNASRGTDKSASGKPVSRVSSARGRNASRPTNRSANSAPRGKKGTGNSRGKH